MAPNSSSNAPSAAKAVVYSPCSLCQPCSPCQPPCPPQCCGCPTPCPPQSPPPSVLVNGCMPCCRPGCKHVARPPPCCWDLPCKADCFNTKAGQRESGRYRCTVHYPGKL